MITKERRDELLHMWLWEQDAGDLAWRDGLAVDEEGLVEFWDMLNRDLFPKEDEERIRRFWDSIWPDDGILDPWERVSST